VRTFASRRVEGSVQLAQRLSKTNSLQYRFSFRRSVVSDLKISPELVPLLSQPVRVGLFSMSYIYDRRDNSTDTHRGILNTVDAGVSLAAFSSQTDYTRLILRNSTYHPLGKEIVLARTLQFGYIQRLGGLAEIPLAERLFAGGSSSQRAFPDNQAGPRDLDTGFPLGGTAMLFHSTELRFRGKRGGRTISRYGQRLYRYQIDRVSLSPAQRSGFQLHGAFGGFRNPLPHTRRPAAPGFERQSRSAPLQRIFGHLAGPADVLVTEYLCGYAPSYQSLPVSFFVGANILMVLC
jgi:hypothetical protein